MSIFSGKLSSKEREKGYGVIMFTPKLFVKADDFFKEVKSNHLPFLTKEEEEFIKEKLLSAEKFKALVPKKNYHRSECRLETYHTNTGYTLYGSNCSCRGGIGAWTTDGGCCGGIGLGFELARKVAAGNISDTDFKNYFIIPPQDIESSGSDDDDDDDDDDEGY
jgi:hypothetical protein